MFSSATAVRAFQAATGIRLKSKQRSLGLRRLLRRFPLLPDVEVFDSTPAQSARFSGRFSVRVTQRETPDLGVDDKGLRRHEVERGPQAGQLFIAATARRANVDVMFCPEVAEPDETVRASWRELTAFLQHL